MATSYFHHIPPSDDHPPYSQSQSQSHLPHYAPTPMMASSSGDIISPGSISDPDPTSPVTPLSSSYYTPRSANPFVLRKLEDNVAVHGQEYIHHQHQLQHQHQHHSNSKIRVESFGRVAFHPAPVQPTTAASHYHLSTFGGDNHAYRITDGQLSSSPSPMDDEEKDDTDLTEYFGWTPITRDETNENASNGFGVPRSYAHGPQAVPMDVDLALLEQWGGRTASMEYAPQPPPARCPPSVLAPAFIPSSYHYISPAPPSTQQQQQQQDEPMLSFAEALAGLPAGSLMQYPENDNTNNQHHHNRPPSFPSPRRKWPPSATRGVEDGSRGSVSPSSSRHGSGKSPRMVGTRHILNAYSTAQKKHQNQHRSAVVPAESDFARALRAPVNRRVVTAPHVPTTTLVAGRFFSEEFPDNHYLNSEFVSRYTLQAQIGSGGFGFVMTARHLPTGEEVAVKFIAKAKLPPEHLVEDPVLGGEVPMEAFILRMTNFKGIVRFLDYYQDEAFFYLVQELHGSPWNKPSALHQKALQPAHPIDPPRNAGPVPRPDFQFGDGHGIPANNIPTVNVDTSYFQFPAPSPFSRPTQQQHQSFGPSPSPKEGFPLNTDYMSHTMEFSPDHLQPSRSKGLGMLPPPEGGRPNLARRPSHDLFECIEQHKNLDERRARYIFMQVLETVQYLDSLGICHRDIKDENLVVDADFNVKLIDFGSAVVLDTRFPEPYYDKFFGTVTFASSEILRCQEYRARPAEIWTLGVLLSFLVTGESPFPDNDHAIAGRPIFANKRKDGSPLILSFECVDLIRGCLRPDPDRRFKLADIQKHAWVRKLRTPPTPF